MDKILGLLVIGIILGIGIAIGIWIVISTLNSREEEA